MWNPFAGAFSGGLSGGGPAPEYGRIMGQEGNAALRPTPYQSMGNMGLSMMQAARPTMITPGMQRGGLPMMPGGYGMPQGLLAPQGPQQPPPQLPPEVLAMLQQKILGGPTNQASWGAGTTTTPTPTPPSRFATPQNLIGSFFNRGGYA